MKVLRRFVRDEVCLCVTSALVLLPGSSVLYCAGHTWLCQMPMYIDIEKKIRVEILSWEVGKPVRVPFKTYSRLFQTKAERLVMVSEKDV